MKKAVILVVGLFVLYYLLATPQDAADAVRWIFDQAVAAFEQVGVFLSEFM